MRQEPIAIKAQKPEITFSFFFSNLKCVLHSTEYVLCMGIGLNKKLVNEIMILLRTYKFTTNLQLVHNTVNTQ
jgi:hypothetical protein